MKLALEKLADHLQGRLAPLYLVSGDETLLVGEACDAIRARARQAGFATREVHFIERVADWAAVSGSVGTMSLFGDQRLLEVRMASAKPGKDGGAVLAALAQAGPETLVLVIAPRLDRDAQSSAWFKALSEAGAWLPVWEVSAAQLPAWLGARCRRVGLAASDEALELLAARVEGNLLAAAQEIEKLHVLFGSGQVSDQQISSVVADAARFDVYDLVDAVLGDMLPRSLRILDGLRGEGTPQPVVLWALARETRTLAALAFRIASGERMDAALARHQPRIWEQRRALVAAALRRLDQQAIHDALLLCSRADRVIKGQERGNGWSALTDVCVALTLRAKLADFGIAGGFC